MHLYEVALDTFILVRATWPAGQVGPLLEQLPQATHAIVQQTGAQSHYYLLTRAEALYYFSRVPAHTAVLEVLSRHKIQATVALDAYANAMLTPDRSVVLDEGQVIGFFDAALPPEAGPRGSKELFQTLDPRGLEQGRAANEPVYRSLVADFPDPVIQDQVVSLLVSLSAAYVAEPALPLPVRPGTTVDIVVQPRRGFSLVGPGEGSCVVTPEAETLPLQFKLRATAPGPALVRVLAFQQGQPLGILTLAPTVLPATPASAPGRRRSREQPLAPASLAQPDLALLILEHQHEGQPAFTLRLSAADPALGLNFKPFGPVRLRLEPLTYFQDFFKDIAGLSLATARDRAVAEQRLAAKGAQLFETLFPPDLQLLLWSLRQRIQTVQVQSEEPWIPWELCKLQGQENGRVVEGPFLGEAFALTRWLPGIGRQVKLKLQNIAVVVPGDSGLPLAGAERDYMLSLAQARRRVECIPATFLDVRRALAAGQYDGWHFIGHGGFRSPDPNRSALLLENRAELTPEDLTGVVKNLGLAHPLVFLNACQIGRSAMSLTDIGGWAAQFLRAGAAAFIGAYWSVYDQAAYDFTRAFYQRLLAGSPIGQAVRAARTSLKSSGDPTWLAYTVFADPLVTVE